MKYYINYQKVTKKYVEELMGKALLAKWVAECKREHERDPLTESTYFIGGNKFLEIKF